MPHFDRPSKTSNSKHRSSPLVMPQQGTIPRSPVSLHPSNLFQCRRHDEVSDRPAFPTRCLLDTALGLQWEPDRA